MKGVIYKIKNNKVKKWEKWLHLLNTKYRKEALKTLKQEEATFEMWTTFKLGNEWYSFGLNDAKVASTKESKLNQKHTEIKKECLEYVTKPTKGVILDI